MIRGGGERGKGRTKIERVLWHGLGLGSIYFTNEKQFAVANENGTLLQNEFQTRFNGTCERPELDVPTRRERVRNGFQTPVCKKKTNLKRK